MIRLSKRSVAVISAFVFGCALVSTASYAYDPCDRCDALYRSCVNNGGGARCEIEHDKCLRRYSCF